MLKFLKMAPQRSPKKPSDAKASQPPQYRSYPPRPPASPPEIVDPIWLLKAVGIVIVAALFCGYASLCFLLYQGQWQLILHPKPSTVVPATIGGGPVELVHFGTDESATPQLTGWAIPAGAGARYPGLTILFLPPGDGSLVDSTPTLALLHHLGVNLFAIDYRGYGQSAAVHPNHARMTQDVESAYTYLTHSRAVPEHQIIPYGAGVAASLAAHLAGEHPAMPAVILDTPGPDPLEIILHDPRTEFLPVRALIHDRFPLAGPLASLKTPKLLLQSGDNSQAFQGASDPKIIVFSLPKPADLHDAPMMTESLTRFLDQYVSGEHLGGTIQPLVPPAYQLRSR